MTQRIEVIAHVVLTGILGTATALVVMLAWNVLVGDGRPLAPNWRTAVVLGMVMAATRLGTDRCQHRGA
jgi:hypothetical protein